MPTDDSSGREATGGAASRWRALALWGLGLTVLAWLVAKVHLREVAAAARSGPALPLVGFAVVQLLISFLTDLWATWIGLHSIRIARPLRELGPVRASSHLVGLLNFTLGQGAIAVYLARSGCSVLEASLATFHLVAISFVTLCLLGAGAVGLGLIVGWPAWSLAAPAALLAVSLLVLLLGPPWIRERLPKTWRARLSVVALATAIGARAVNFCVFMALYWLALRIWGFDISLWRALPVVLVLMLIAALPLTPYGTGTVQLGQILLLAPYATGATAAEREAFVLAFGLLHQAASVVTQASLGLIGAILWRHRVASTTWAPPSSTTRTST